jgi:hypothetical protein
MLVDPPAPGALVVDAPPLNDRLVTDAEPSTTDGFAGFPVASALEGFVSGVATCATAASAGTTAKAVSTAILQRLT